MTESTKEKIISATYKLMECSEDIGKITVRQIAQSAEVNVALVNYHFKTKENLFNEVIGKIMEGAKSLFGIFENDTLTAREQLIQFFVSYQEYLLEHKKFLAYLIQSKKSMPNQLIYMDFLKQNGINIIQERFSNLLKKKQLSSVSINDIAGEFINVKNSEVDRSRHLVETNMGLDIIVEARLLFQQLVSIILFPVFFQALINEEIKEKLMGFVGTMQGRQSIEYFFDKNFPEY